MLFVVMLLIAHQIEQGAYLKREETTLRSRKSTNMAVAAVFASISIGFTACAPGQLSGDRSVTIYAPFYDSSVSTFRLELDLITKNTGIQIDLQTPRDISNQIQTDLRTGSLPDIVIWDNPRDLLNQTDNLVPLEKLVDVKAIGETLIPGWGQVATMGRNTFGLPVTSNIKTGNKSLVFYNPAAFEQYGYDVPQNAQDMLALIDRIKRDKSGYPWCSGIASGGATGWPATDWLEQYVLEQQGIEDYQRWISGDLEFSSAKVSSSAKALGDMILTTDSLPGGGAQASITDFGNTDALFSNSGKSGGQCFMMKQGLFIADFFPASVKSQIASGDFSSANAFAMPAIAGGKQSVIGDGYIASAFKEDSDVAKVLGQMLNEKFGVLMIQNGPFMSPHKTFPLENYPQGFSRAVARATSQAEQFGFDASTAMPRAVSDEFWISVTRWFKGEVSWSKAAKTIDATFGP